MKQRMWLFVIVSIQQMEPSVMELTRGCNQPVIFLTLSLNLKISLICLLPLLIGLGVWVKDGARVAFWLTSIEERKEVPIVEGMPELGTQTQVTWKEQFVSGIETPLIGTLLATIVFLITRWRINLKQ